MRWIARILLIASFIGCRTASPTGAPRSSATNLPPASTSSQATDPESDARAKAHAAFAAGLLRGMNHDDEGMLDHFERSVLDAPDNEQLALDVARRRLQANLPQRALNVLEPTLRRHGTNAELQNLRGLALLQLNRTDEALATYQTTTALPGAPLISFATVARLLVAQQKFPEALASLDRAPRAATNGVGHLLDLADVYLQLGSAHPGLTNQVRERVLDLLKTARPVAGDDAPSLLRVADRYQALGYPGESEQLYRQMRERAGRDPVPAARLAEMFIRQGKLREATEQLEAIRRIDPGNVETYYYLGLIAVEEQQFEKARNHLERVVLLNPGFAPAYADLGATHLNLQKPAEALDVLGRARRDFAPSFRVEYLSAIAHSRLKQYDDAFARYLAAEVIARTNQPTALDERFYFQIGALLEQKGDLPGSVQYLEKSLSLNPDFDEALNHLGYLWADRGENLDRARDMIERALKAEPDNAAYLDSLGWVHFKLGRPADALPLLEKAHRLMPEPDPTVLEHLGDTYAALGRWAEARKSWEASLKLQPADAIAKKLREAEGK
jgi:tetratricopeptide (TPR) repeat protein